MGNINISLDLLHSIWVKKNSIFNALQTSTSILKFSIPGPLLSPRPQNMYSPISQQPQNKEFQGKIYLNFEGGSICVVKRKGGRKRILLKLTKNNLFGSLNVVSTYAELKMKCLFD